MQDSLTHAPAAESAVSTKSLTSMAFDQIRGDILLGKLKPNERLRIQNLSERYGVGPTAIREALSRLVTDGLVDSEDQRGFGVAPVSRADLLDLTQTRVDIEGLALRRAIANGDVEWETRVVSAFHRLSRCTPPVDSDGNPLVQWSIAHRQFHEALVSGCGSPWLLRLCGLLYDKSERYRNLADRKTNPQQRDTVSEHRALMDAVIGRDADLAAKLIDEHFRETTNIILQSDIMAPAKSRAVTTRGTKAP